MTGQVRLLVAGAASLAFFGIVAAPGQQAGFDQGLRATILSAYTPPPCVPGVPFADIQCTTPFDAWIEQFGLDGITAGCGGGNYCPEAPVTRAQMAVFIESAMRGTSNWPFHTVLVFHHPAAEVNSDADSGAELLSMVAAIPASGSEAPSEEDPWIVHLGPGTFDLGTNTLSLPPYVSIEGSGMDDTVIVGGEYLQGTVQTSGGRNSFIRVTIKSVVADFSRALVTFGGRIVLDRARILNETPLTAVCALDALDSNLEVTNNSEILTPFAVNGKGVQVGASALRTLEIRNSIVEGPGGAIVIGDRVVADVVHSRIGGPLVKGLTGVFRCVGNYDPNLLPVTCP